MEPAVFVRPEAAKDIPICGFKPPGDAVREASDSRTHSWPSQAYVVGQEPKSIVKRKIEMNLTAQPRGIPSRKF